MLSRDLFNQKPWKSTIVLIVIPLEPAWWPLMGYLCMLPFGPIKILKKGKGKGKGKKRLFTHQTLNFFFTFGILIFNF